MQPTGEISSAHLPDELWVSTHDELIARTGQPDVQALTGAFEC
jgi:hypothetical protein